MVFLLSVDGFRELLRRVLAGFNYIVSLDFGRILARFAGYLA